MKKLIIISILFLTGCAQSKSYSPQEQARVMSDWYLCKNVDEAGQSEIRNAEVVRRGLDCKDVLEKKEMSAQQRTKIENQKYKEAAKMLAKKPKIRNVYDQVLADSIDQYHIVSNNGGSSTEQCVYAGMVKAAAAQAKNAEFYSNWNDVEKLHCAIAKWAD